MRRSYSLIITVTIHPSYTISLILKSLRVQYPHKPLHYLLSFLTVSCSGNGQICGVWGRVNFLNLNTDFFPSLEIIYSYVSAVIKKTILISIWIFVFSPARVNHQIPMHFTTMTLNVYMWESLKIYLSHRSLINVK